MVEQTQPEVLHLGAKKRKLQRACDTCRRRKGQLRIRTEETSEADPNPPEFPAQYAVRSH